MYRLGCLVRQAWVMARWSGSYWCNAGRWHMQSVGGWRVKLDKTVEFLKNKNVLNKCVK